MGCRLISPTVMLGSDPTFTRRPAERSRRQDDRLFLYAIFSDTCAEFP